jgi:DNA modification methylase
VRFIGVDDLVVLKDRQRQEHDPEKQVRLMESIASLGLRNAITVRQENGQCIVVAGERRLRAIKDLWQMGESFAYEGKAVGFGTVPCVDEGEIDPLRAEEMEFDENDARADLTWQERAAATARLDRIRRRQAAASGNPPPTVGEIAAELRGPNADHNAFAATRQELILAAHLDDPEISGAATPREAYKILKRKEESLRNTRLAEAIGRNMVSAASRHNLLRGDALEWLAKCPESSYDVILTDPPYGMGADEFGDAGGRTSGAHTYEDTEENFLMILAACATHFIRIAKPQAHLYWFCDIDAFHTSRQHFTERGWWVHRTPLIWHKPTNPRLPWPDHGPQRKWEMILYAVKGKRPTRGIFPDLITVPSDDNLGYAAQKPVELFTDLLKRSVNPDDTVCDPFCGTGTIFPAANAVHCRATGVELNSAAYGIAAKRILDLDQERKLL